MKYMILHILCEGQTEERFVKEVLAPYLQPYNIFSKPISLLTSKKKNIRGGMLNYLQAKRDLNILQKQNRDNDSEYHVFTTMFDYYALPDDFPHFIEASRIGNIRERLTFLEQQFSKDLGCRSFIPYIQLHEFEALLFVDIDKLKTDYPLAGNGIQKLKEDTALYNDPEMINDGPKTAPSKRIIKALENEYNYNKVQSGSHITSLIGIEKLMDKCLHFKEWVEAIVAMANYNSLGK